MSKLEVKMHLSEKEMRKIEDLKTKTELVDYFSSLMEDFELLAIIDIYKQFRHKFEKISLIDSGEFYLTILKKLEMYDEIKKEIEYFEEKPYISQETEERLHDLDRFLEIKNRYDKNYTLEDIKKDLASEDVDATLKALDQLSLKEYEDVDLNDYIAKNLNSRTKYSISFGILLTKLIKDKYDRMPIVLKTSKIYINLIPKEFHKIHQEFADIFFMIMTSFHSSEKNISILDFVTLYAVYVYYYLAYSIPNSGEIPTIYVVCLDVAFELFNIDPCEDYFYMDMLDRSDDELIEKYKELLIEMGLLIKNEDMS